jgi:DNA polymerase IV
MNYLTNLKFNPKPSTIMHIDLNSCFASIEQQANPKLRGKPIGVAAYTTDRGCIVAPSIEAKKYGVKVGMRVKDGKQLCPELIILPPDPWKYRNIHIKFRQLFHKYTDKCTPKSIDEFVLNFEGTPSFRKQTIHDIAQQLKKEIKQQVGDYLTVSIGIAPNRYLAKVAAGLQKPDGLHEINQENFIKTYQNLQLTDLPWIKGQNAKRLNNQGIFSVTDFYNADLFKIKSAFQSILSFHWFARLRGWEVDDVVFGRRSYGNSYSLPKPFSTEEDLSPILHKLVEKCTARMRKAGYKAKGVHISILYRNKAYWHKGVSTADMIFSSQDVYKIAYDLMNKSPYRGHSVANIAVSCFNIAEAHNTQLELFQDILKKERLSQALDDINNRYGQYVITPAAMLHTQQYVPDRVAFGGIKELEEFTLNT